MPARILIVDAELKVQSAVESALRKEGFHVKIRTNGRDAMELACQEEPDLMIVNFELPDIPGQEFCQKIRQTPKARTIPILAMFGRNADGLSTRCLNSGADGYLTKPVDRDELIAYTRALLRRPRTYLTDDSVIRKGRICARLAERRIFFDKQPIESLTPKEYALILEIIARAPRVVEKTALVMKIWGVSLDQLDRRTLDVHVQRLRRKLGPVASSFLKTIPLIGYQWVEPPHP